MTYIPYDALWRKEMEYIQFWGEFKGFQDIKKILIMLSSHPWGR
jgi:hypothetical protein